MKTPLKKTLLFWLLILAAAVSAILYTRQSSYSPIALAVTLVLLGWYLYRYAGNRQKSEALPSVLPQGAKDALARGEIPAYRSALKCKPGETLYWADAMRVDYEGAKVHIIYLTDQSLTCLDEDFAFSYPLNRLELRQNGERLSVKKEKTTLIFRAASPEAFRQALALIEGGQTSLPSADQKTGMPDKAETKQ